MRIVNVEQGSEEWEALRRGVPTASNLGEIVTPAKGQLSSSAERYAAKLIAQSHGVVIPPPPSFWMQWGIDTEPYAVKAYETITDRTTEKIGFVWGDGERYGCSPDRFVGTDGILEVKCPMPETVVEYHLNGELPLAYKPQVQGQLLITEREWCDFIAYHPELKPFLIRVERDEKYIAAIQVALDEFCEMLDSFREKLSTLGEKVAVELTDNYQPMDYEVSEVQL